MTIPILSFNWSQFEADISNIKQLIIQFEASGDIYVDEIKIVEHQGSLKARAEVPLYKVPMTEEEVFKAMETSGIAPIAVEDNKIRLAILGQRLFMIAEVVDESPLQNTRSADKLWDGDAIELAFSSNATAAQSRSYFLFSDHQIGIRAAKDAYIWNWKGNAQISDASYQSTLTDNGYQIKASFSLSSLGVPDFEVGAIYGLEVAIDQGTNDGRQQQLRWNEPDIGGFYENPSLWGEMKIVVR